MLHEQYGRTGSEASGRVESKLEAREGEGGAMTRQLLEAIGADGDVRRLVDWVRNSFNLASIGEITTQFVVSKLGSVNCAAILAPDREQSLVPRFLLFNEHFLDVPFELALEPTPDECLARAKFDPLRKTVLLVHGYLSGYTLLDGLTNIKNRLLDLNRLASERTLETFVRMSERLNGSYLLTDDLQAKLRQQQFNVIIVDWFNGANPTPRANYIRAAVNAQVVGRLIARFLSSLVVNCSTPAASLNIIAHSLGELALASSGSNYHFNQSIHPLTAQTRQQVATCPASPARPWARPATGSARSPTWTRWASASAISSRSPTSGSAPTTPSRPRPCTSR